MNNGKWILGIGLGGLAIFTIFHFMKKNQEPKGKGDVTADSKKENKITFTKKN